MSPFELFAYFTALSILFLTVDDLFIDLLSLVYRLGPKELSPEELTTLHSLKEKKIAVMIANWQEAEVLQRMVTGNLRQIQYRNFDIFLGVYPNDIFTWNEASALSKKYPQVHVIVNPEHGPTTKGQMLNVIFGKILDFEKHADVQYDLFMLHDSEDIIHPLSLKLINAEAEKNDFIQIPVLSLPVRQTQFVANTYVDEFSESHGKELCVRSFLNAGVPSAGVGTAFNRKLALHTLNVQGELLRADTLTEDYFLGIMSHLDGFQSAFVNRYLNSNGKKDFIVTKEYFPQKIKASIRQKTRWTIGINLQGLNLIGWSGPLRTRYFLWRDRRSLINSVLILFSLMLIVLCVVYEFAAETPDFVRSRFFFYLTLVNTSHMALRIAQRMRYVYFFYDFQTALLVPFRWLVANYINTIAAFKAFQIYLNSRVRNSQPKWLKTEHSLPADFGRDVEAKEVSL